MAVRAGLQQDYNTFNLEEGQLSNINVRIFLANEYIQNYPEQPQVKFTEKDTTIFSGIYPTLAENLTGEVDATTSDTLNKLVNSSVQGNGDELYNTQDAYQNYSNNFHLSSSLEGERQEIPQKVLSQYIQTQRNRKKLQLLILVYIILLLIRYTTMRPIPGLTKTKAILLLLEVFTTVNTTTIISQIPLP